MKIRQLIERLKRRDLALIQEYGSAVLTFLMAGIIVDIFLLPGKSDIRTFSLVGFYVLAIRVYHFDSKNTFSVCFFLLFLLFIGFISTGASDITEKAAVWLFIFMATGIFQELLRQK